MENQRIVAAAAALHVGIFENRVVAVAARIDVGIRIESAGEIVVAEAAGEGVGIGEAVDGVVAVGAGGRVEIPDDIFPTEVAAVGEREDLDTVGHGVEQAVIHLELILDRHDLARRVDQELQIVGAPVPLQRDIRLGDARSEVHVIAVLAPDPAFAVVDGHVAIARAVEVLVGKVAAGHGGRAVAGIEEIEVSSSDQAAIRRRPQVEAYRLCDVELVPGRAVGEFDDLDRLVEILECRDEPGPAACEFVDDADLVARAVLADDEIDPLARERQVRNVQVGEPDAVLLAVAEPQPFVVDRGVAEIVADDVGILAALPQRGLIRTVDVKDVVAGIAAGGGAWAHEDLGLRHVEQRRRDVLDRDRDRDVLVSRHDAFEQKGVGDLPSLIVAVEVRQHHADDVVPLLQIGFGIGRHSRRRSEYLLQHRLQLIRRGRTEEIAARIIGDAGEERAERTLRGEPDRELVDFVPGRRHRAGNVRDEGGGGIDGHAEPDQVAGIALQKSDVARGQLVPASLLRRARQHLFLGRPVDHKEIGVIDRLTAGVGIIGAEIVLLLDQVIIDDRALLGSGADEIEILGRLGARRARRNRSSGRPSAEDGPHGCP